MTQIGRKRRARFDRDALRRHAFDPKTRHCWRCGRHEDAVTADLLPCLEADNVISIVPEIVARRVRRRKRTG